MNGLGVESNLSEALTWYEKAAEKGDAAFSYHVRASDRLDSTPSPFIYISPKIE